jgi:hypothetical protein
MSGTESAGGCDEDLRALGADADGGRLCPVGRSGLLPDAEPLLDAFLAFSPSQRQRTVLRTVPGRQPIRHFCLSNQRTFAQSKNSFEQLWRAGCLAPAATAPLDSDLSRLDHGADAYVRAKTASISPRRNDSLSLNCLNSSVSSFIRSTITFQSAVSISTLAFWRSEFAMALR